MKNFCALCKNEKIIHVYSNDHIYIDVDTMI